MIIEYDLEKREKNIIYQKQIEGEHKPENFEMKRYFLKIIKKKQK